MVDGRTTTSAFRARTLIACGAAALLLATTACAHVSKDDFEAEMAQVRTEIRTGDEAVESRLSNRIDAVAQRLDRLEAELRALEDEFDMEIERLEASLRVYTPVHFGFDSADLDGEDVEVLRRLAGVLNQHYPTALVTVEGFTDPAGSVAYNLRLGQRRADAVRGWLVADGGFAAPQVRSVSYGESTERLVRPGEYGPGAAGRENRRVVVVIDHAASGTGGIVAEEGQGG